MVFRCCLLARGKTIISFFFSYWIGPIRLNPLNSLVPFSVARFNFSLRRGNISGFSPLRVLWLRYGRGAGRWVAWRFVVVASWRHGQNETNKNLIIITTNDEKRKKKRESLNGISVFFFSFILFIFINFGFLDSAYFWNVDLSASCFDAPAGRRGQWTRRVWRFFLPLKREK